MIQQVATTETPLQIALRARRAGIRLRVDSKGEIIARLPPGTHEVPAWLREAKAMNEQALGFAVALCAAVERSGGDPAELLGVQTILLEGVQ